MRIISLVDFRSALSDTVGCFFDKILCKKWWREIVNVWEIARMMGGGSHEVCFMKQNTTKPQYVVGILKGHLLVIITKFVKIFYFEKGAAVVFVYFIFFNTSKVWARSFYILCE